jgi:hypothetical protein
VNRSTSAFLTALLAAMYAALFVGSVTGHIGPVFISALAIVILDALVTWVADSRIAGVLTAIGAGVSWRVFARDIIVVVLLFRIEAAPVALGVVVGALLAHQALFMIHSSVGGVIRSRRSRRLETRNLPVPGDTLPPRPPAWLLASGGWLLLQTDLLFIAALGWAFATGSDRLFAPASIAMVVVAAVIPVLLTSHTVALLRLPSDELRLRAAQQAVLDRSPLVILYFSGEINSVYQLNMWLETIERLERPALVLVRERAYLSAVAPTSLPLLCLPSSVDLMNFMLPSVRVALYVANVGRNIHLLREPGIKSAFISHGDSDKAANFNPFAKVYDEVWVAGEAGRQRYARAGIGVRAEEIVVVGRPQLLGITPARRRPPGEPYTVLYAPTWEGWTKGLQHSSVLPLGYRIVRTLLGMDGVRVIYKPHPLTGTVDPAVGAASAAIAALITAAGDAHLYVADDSRTLYDLFNESDALISDVSSVVSDYLRSEKPYFVTNPAGLPDAQFRELNPSAGAAYLIGPQAVGLVRGIESAHGADEMRARRHEVRTYLLGDPDSDPMALFRNAVDNLAAKARPADGDADDDDDLRAAADHENTPEREMNGTGR